METKTHLNSRRNFLRKSALFGIAATLATATTLPKLSYAHSADMGTLKAIMTRRSVRSFTDEVVSQEDIDTMLKAAMAAPSAGNERPWEFIVVTDKKIIQELAEKNRNASMAKNAPLIIVTCINHEREKYIKDGKGYGPLDVSAATQNLLLAAHSMGLGAVWTGAYPMEDRVTRFQDLFKLPEHVVPLAVVVIGHPKDKPQERDNFLPDRIHRNKWQGK